MTILHYLFSYSGALTLVFVLVLMAAWLAMQQHDLTVGRRGAAIVGSAWVVVVTAEFWLAGPYSFSRLAVNMDFGLATDLFLIARTQGEQFSHALAGGMDLAAMSLHTGQIVSLERILLSALPLWFANMLHHLSVSGTAFVGSYLLARHFAQADRIVALPLAALYTLAHERLIHYTWPHGLGFGLIPLLVYLFVVRVGRPRYWLGVALGSAVYAVSSSPTHSFLAAGGALGFATLLAPSRAMARAFGALAVLTLAEIGNWHESLYAKALLAPFSYRASESSIGEPALGLFENLGYSAHHQWMFVLVAAAGCLFAARRGDRRAPLLTVVALLSFAAGIVADTIPWSAIGLGALEGVTLQNISYGFPIIAIMIAAAAPPLQRVRRTAYGVAWGLALATLAVTKVANLSSWLSEGGLQVLSASLRQLEVRPWQASEPQRVISVPYRLPVNLAAAAGLDTFDGALNLNLESYSRYWQLGIQRAYRARHGGTSVEKSSSFIDVQSPDFDFKCCASYDITDHADLAFLRIANVGHILSTLPLRGAGIRKVAGLADDAPPPRNTEPLGERVLGYLRLIRESAPIYVYRLEAPLPRVFSAAGVVELPGPGDADALVRAIADNALERRIVVAAADAPRLRRPSGMVIEHAVPVADGYDVTVSAPDGGILVVNAPYLPFWRATADADTAPLPIVAANMVHMAIAIPPGAHKVSIRYERPRLRDRLRGN